MKRLFPPTCRSGLGRDDVTDHGSRDANLARLMTFVQDGDKQSYAQLLLDCASLLRAGALRHGIEGDLADLYVETTLVTVHHARHTYDPSRSFEFWLDAISHRVATDLRRGARRQATQVMNAPLAFGRH